MCTKASYDYKCTKYFLVYFCSKCPFDMTVFFEFGDGCMLEVETLWEGGGESECNNFNKNSL